MKIKTQIGTLFFYGIFILSVIQITSCKKEFSQVITPTQPGNKPPLANAGADETIILPKDSILLNCTASTDPDGTIVSYQWIKISGPASFNILKTDSSRTLVKTLVMGVYKFELTVKDNGGLSTKDTVQIIVNDPAINQPPVSNAGPDQIITLPIDSVLLNGIFSFDPNGSITSWQWTKIAGPSSSSIINSQVSQTIVKGLVMGIYKFELTVMDNGGLSAKDTVQIIVDNPLIYQPPIANAGPDQTITLPINSVTLNGNGSSAPNGSIIGYSWTKIGGPAQGNILAPANAISPVNNLVLGTYFFRLKITDNNGLFGYDTVMILVNYMPSSSCSGYCVCVLNPGIFSSVSYTSSPNSGGDPGAHGVAVAAADKIFFAGGHDEIISGGPYATVLVYNVNSGGWNTLLMSQPRSHLAGATVNNKVLFAGGQDGIAGVPGGYGPTISTYYDNVDIFDANTYSSSTSHLSEPRANIASATVGNKAYFMGGKTSSGYSRKIDVYDANTNSWALLQLPNSRAFGSAGVVGNNIYVCGGINETGRLKTIDVYNVITATWSVLQAPNEHPQASVISLNNKIFIAGGDGVANKSLDIFNAVTNSWSTQQLSNARYDMGVAVANNKIIFLGGNYSNSIDMYDDGSATLSSTVMNESVTGTMGTTLNNKCFFAGFIYQNGWVSCNEVIIIQP